MAWGCFFYNHKDPMHYQKPETSTQKKAAEKDLAQLDKILELHMRVDLEVK